MVLPQPGGGCLACEGLVPPGKLQLEELSVEERRAQGYFGAEGLDDEIQPSVITLNVVSAAHALNDLMMMFVGLYCEDQELPSLRFMALDRDTYKVRHMAPRLCRHCSRTGPSLYARGDYADLPCKLK